MGNNKTLFIVLAIAVVLLVITLMSGGLNFSEGEDPAMSVASRLGGSSDSSRTSAPEPAPEPEPEAAPAPAGDAAESEPAPQASGAAGAAAPAGVTPGAGAEPAAEGAPADGGEAEGSEELAPGTEEGQGAAEGMEGLEEAGELLEGDAAVPEDPIERFKMMDPVDIIKDKYNDLEGKLTSPWDESNPETWIPQTGRVDPLTRVFDEIPDDLKPPRAGETDISKIQTFLASSIATEAVNGVALALVCHNVLQIGLEKYASFSFGGDATQAQTVPEGGGFGVANQGVNVNVSVTSISQDLVVVVLSASINGQNLGISKTQYYIPAKNV